MGKRVSRAIITIMQYWVMKSEPSQYAISDLERDGTTVWDGIRNYQVRNFIRDRMQVGDRAYFYHSNCRDIGIVGELEVVGEAIPDTLQFDAKSYYFDPSSTKQDPRWLAVPVAHVATFSRVIPRTELITLSALKDSPLIRAGNRLSVVPLTKREYTAIQKLIH